MFGTKHLKTIRQEIEEALSTKRNDPISQLDSLIRFVKKRNERSEVFEELKKFVQTQPKRKRGKYRTGK